MATERDLELLDDYLANKLSGTEKLSFEQKLHADPDLNNELKFQQRLVNGIKNARVAELKTMLNNTPIPAGYGGSSALTKFVVGGAVASLVAVGVYFYTQRNEEQQYTTEEITNPIIDSTEKQEEEVTSNEEPAASKETKTPVQEESAKTENKGDNQDADSPVASKPSLNVFDPTTENNEETATDVEEPAGERLTENAEGAPAITVEIERENKDFQFHYQFKNGKLFLYGPFESNLYEIMEFFSNEKRTVFLYYKNGYYLLEEKNANINSLKPITDSKLLEKLKQYRKN